ncbi:hypothetical protein DICPUDRAFT_46791 [Dictyostelium purpureum]|uniref:UspA domain-containing protein n=1 Tax=Dictyostelium purpureum TaxID=5786 RepID=F0ZGA4_DICPU|nr:uncharacterized protein DICPUDRAFT_46791 [Dictyostelium purpureum]EGC37027.1 hypothetical protein DICPUDRAFT_46791 [Dictyostelium purpureum]|eukprot:XP_003286455.1 hypothetical protein DICPUDRAFT_46791 [Dictyostelium purpureum]
MRFLIALDGSAGAHKAFIRAVSLYKDTDTIVAVVVMDMMHFVMSNQKSDMTLISNMKEEMLKNGQELIKKYEDLAKNDYCIENFEGICVEGNPRDVIVKTVEDKSIDILCLGRVGLLNTENITMGSTSNYCIRNCKCDVLVCR